MRFSTRTLLPLPLISLVGMAFLLFSGSAQASPHSLQPQTTPVPYQRPGPPPTIYPPSQADNGAQIYWGICQDCHGDQGQGLTAEWRAAFAPAYQDCWASGCHGQDPAPRSFTIPDTGAPALAAPGALPQFSTAFELGTYIQESMPLSPTGSLSEQQAWELTAFILSLHDLDQPSLTLSGTTSAAIPLHRAVALPENPIPGVLALSLLLTLVGILVLRSPAVKKAGRENFFHHLHPPKIPAAQARFGFTLAAGGLSVFFCLVLLVTGALEMYYYIPASSTAGASIQTITNLVPYGSLVRNLHYWSAQMLVVVAMIHLVRVILTGAYAPPRRFNYLLGLMLLVVVLLLDFTGYVLRWDEGIRWALVVGTNLLKTIPTAGEGLYRFIIGGAEVGPASLTRFYAWHIYGLTLVAAAIAAWHFFRVRRDGGISSPAAMRGEPPARIPRSELVKKEVAAMLLAGAALLLLALLLPAPLDQPISDQGLLSGDSRAPWFFLWIQQTLQLGDPFLWGVILPLGAVIVLGALPYLLPNAKPEEQGRWFPAGNRAGQILGMAVIGLILVLTLLGWICGV
jgi:quinol-cytochrome oxidoreductase complex cytochrome b subunit/mono/diheme cytochrome c family protein